MIFPVLRPRTLALWTAVVVGVLAGTGPGYAETTWVWHDEAGVMQMSNIASMVPPNHRPAPESPICGTPTASRVVVGDAMPMTRADKEMARLQQGIEGLARRNQNILQLRAWMEKLTADPNRLGDADFLTWVRQLTSPTGQGPSAFGAPSVPAGTKEAGRP
ncbi:MAG: hypothetical protein JEZ11_01620 [Desulfobacterales bacterium]|nr:hypothetical protein [Desulfobacterales bacterium]